MNKMELKEMLHYYLGQKIEHNCNSEPESYIAGNKIVRRVSELDSSFLNCILEDWKWHKPKLILRPISDMKKKEIGELLVLVMDSPKLSEDARITLDEIFHKIVRNNEAHLWNVEISVRCFEGALNIYDNGDLTLMDEEESVQAIERQALITHYLLSKGFDLFGLIGIGLAIDDKARLNKVS